MDLKQFLEKQSVKEVTCGECQNVLTGNIVSVYGLGLFFWERGGKQFARICIGWKELGFFKTERLAKELCSTRDSAFVYEARDFLDALACLGSDRIKELIKDLNGDNNVK